MRYYKFNIDEMHQNRVFMEYREITEDSKGDLLSRSFPLPAIGAVEPKFLEMVAGPITGIYYEARGDSEIRETNYINKNTTISDEDVTFMIQAVEKACIHKQWDDLLKPPSVDEQVEDFIKEFFQDNQEQPLEQKDFLAEFFAELEVESKE